MKFHLLITAVAGMALTVVACGPAAEQPAAEAPSPAEDVAAIKNALDKGITAVHAGDASALAACYMDDAIVMPPNEASLTGKEGLRSWIEPHFSQFTEKISAQVAEVEVVGDWAFLRATYTVTLTPKAGGEPSEDSGKWLQIYKRQPDGSWQIAREIWNSDKPLPGAGE